MVRFSSQKFSPKIFHQLNTQPSSQQEQECMMESWKLQYRWTRRVDNVEAILMEQEYVDRRSRNSGTKQSVWFSKSGTNFFKKYEINEPV